MDYRNSQSRTSLEVDIQESVEFQTYQQYISNLKKNNQVISLALRKAEDIIQEYQRLNAQLKSRNQYLQNKTLDLNDQIQYLKNLLLKDNGNKMQAKIVDLTLRNQKVEKRMTNLAEQLEKSQAKIAKLTKLKQDHTQKQLNNYFQFATPKSHNNSKQNDLSREIRSLKWKLQQREQEITFMIKRNKMLEQKFGGGHKQGSGGIHKNFKKVIDDDRFYTCQTQPNKMSHF